MHKTSKKKSLINIIKKKSISSSTHIYLPNLAMAVVSWERKIANIVIGLIILVTFVCLMLGPIASWIWAISLQAALVCSGGYYFMVLVDYQEKVGLDAPGVERQLNPFMLAEDAARMVLLASAVLALMSPTLVIVGILEAVYIYGFRKVKRVDSTKLWKEINGALFDAKVLLIAHCLHFAVGLAVMIYAFISML